MTLSKRRFSHSKWEEDLSEELRNHLESQTKAHIAAGMHPEEARREALVEFGAIEGFKEDCRGQRRGFWIEALGADIRYGLRMLRRNPGFAAAAILTLALGIGASTAVFSLVDAILMKPLAYPDAGQIVMVWNKPPAGLSFVGLTDLPWARVSFLSFSREARTFTALAAFKSDSFNLTGAGEPARLDGIRASAEFFPALGVTPVLGRTFSPKEDQKGRESEVVLSYALWRERFGADPQILGRVLELNGTAYTVIGVMPSGFVFPRAEEMPAALNFAREAQLWVPLALDPGPLIPAEPSELTVVGRVKQGITLDEARAELEVLGDRLEAQYPRAKDWFHSRVVPLPEQVSGDTRQPLLLILAAVGVVLLIACSNVAGLLLARSVGRRQEFTLRTALGAERGRLIRQVLTESLVLAFAGGLIGLLLARSAISVTKVLGPTDLPRLREAGMNGAVLAFAIGVTLITGMLFGLVPAIAAGRHNIAHTLREGGQRSSQGQGSVLRRALLVSEMALAFVLMVAAGLLTRTFFRLMSADSGFNATRVLTFELSLPVAKYTDQQRIVALYQNALQRLKSIPGVQAAGIVETVPMGGSTESTAIRIPGRNTRDSNENLSANYTMISPGYLAAIGTPILRGRDFTESDTADSAPVALISASMAKEFWPGEDPLGKQVGPRSTKYPAATIVGITADVKHISLREDYVPEMYVPYTQKVWPSLLTMDVVLRASTEPTSLTSSVREAIHAADPDLPLAKVATLASLVDGSMAKPRFSMLLLAGFGTIALLLASIGMYGVIAYSVAQRTKEIGIRMALGAQRSSVFRGVVGEGMRLAGLGTLLGFLGALAVARLMAGFLYGVRPMDVATFATASLLILGVALLASYIPAWRATRLDPMVALRYE